MGSIVAEFLLTNASSEIIKDKYANCRRKIVAIAALVDQAD